MLRGIQVDAIENICAFLILLLDMELIQVSIKRWMDNEDWKG